MKIQVTQDCIDNGTPEDANCCAVALAVKHAIPDAEGVWVTGDHIEFIRAGQYEAFTTSEAVADFIEAFDSNGDPDPIEFEIDFDPAIDGVVTP